MRVLLLTPIAPAEGFNGMAMRSQRMVDAFADDELVLVVVPAADSTCEVRRSPSAIRQPLAGPDPHEERSVLASLLADPRWRARLTGMGTLPRLAERVPVTWRDTVLRSLDGWMPEVVVVQRSYLAPLGLAVAERVGAASVLDLDDDDVAVCEQLGDPDAEAFARLVRTMAPEFDLVLAASASEASAIAARQGIVEPAVVPNAVVVPDDPLALPAPVGDGPLRVLTVGNFGYRPNRDGLDWLCGSVAPHLAATGGPVAIHAVGRGLVSGLPVTVAPGVTLVPEGPVDDLRPHYLTAHVVAVPILAGGGTRLKVLEALALGRPVVSTALGAAGLGLTDGREVVLADTPSGFAAGLRRVAVDDRLATALVSGGRAAVLEYRADRVSRGLRRLVVEGAARPR